MDLAHIQIALQTLSSLAIAGGLVYTAMQFRAWRKAAYVANFSKLVELQMMLRKMRVDDPSLASVYKHDVQGLTSDREIREYFMNIMQLSVFEIVWFSWRNGQLPRDYFDSWVKRMEAIEHEDSFRRMMASPAMKILHDDFQRYIQDLMSRPGAKG
jgi:hypothetical protein